MIEKILIKLNSSYVLVDYYLDSTITKLHIPKSGPNKIMNNTRSEYTLRNLGTNKIAIYYVSLLLVEM